MRERPPVPAVVGESARQLLFVVVEVVVVVRPSLGEKVVRQLPLAVGVLVARHQQPEGEGVEGVGPANLARVPEQLPARVQWEGEGAGEGGGWGLGWGSST